MMAQKDHSQHHRKGYKKTACCLQRWGSRAQSSRNGSREQGRGPGTPVCQLPPTQTHKGLWSTRSAAGQGRGHWGKRDLPAAKSRYISLSPGDSVSLEPGTRSRKRPSWRIQPAYRAGDCSEPGHVWGLAKGCEETQNKFTDSRQVTLAAFVYSDP